MRSLNKSQLIVTLTKDCLIYGIFRDQTVFYLVNINLILSKNQPAGGGGTANPRKFALLIIGEPRDAAGAAKAAIQRNEI